MKCPRKFLAAGFAIGLAGAVWALPQSSQGPSLRKPGEPVQQPPSQQSPAVPPQDQDSGPRIRATVSLVVVPVSVKDQAGELVSDLQQNDFRIFEDGIEQEIAVFSADATPLSAAVLLDDDLKRSSADHVQKTLEDVAAGFSDLDEVSLWRFDDVPESLSENFISDNNELLAQLKRIDLNSTIPGAGSAPMTAGPVVNTQPLPGPLQPSAVTVGHANEKHINDAIYAGAEQLENRPRDRRKIIFIISDGQNAKNNTHSYDETLKMLLSSDVSVYAIAVGEANLNRRLNVLAKYARATGGDIFYASNAEDLERLYSRASEQARNQYTIAYAPARTDRTQPYHLIEVRVKRPGLVLLTRDGYYANPQPER